MSKLYPVQEIGRLAKPRWRPKGLTKTLSSTDQVEAAAWAQRLGGLALHGRANRLIIHRPLVRRTTQPESQEAEAGGEERVPTRLRRTSDTARDPRPSRCWS